MNRIQTYAIGTLFAILVLLGFWFAYWLFQVSTSPAPAANPQTSGAFTPGASQSASGFGSNPQRTSGQAAQGSPSPAVSVATTNGASLATSNFLQSSDVVSATPLSKQGLQAETYYSIGSSPFEIAAWATTSASLPSPLSKGYEILYFPDGGTFSIFIFKEPIGDVRRAMAKDLAGRLGVATTDLCNLVAVVWVSPRANTFYAGKNVGFPGCPGATAFPGD